MLQISTEFVEGTNVVRRDVDIFVHKVSNWEVL